jgi:hypothetical protein
MSAESEPKLSFSPYRKWGIGFNVGVVILVVFAVVVMVNYLSHAYFLRLHLSTNTKYSFFPRTTSFLHSVTNRVKVTLFYDHNDPLYSTVADLLKEYNLSNPKITIQNVDYLRDPGSAQKVKSNYKLGAATDKDLVIFDCEGRTKVVYGSELANYTIEQMPEEKDRKFLRKLVSFAGERAFTSALIAVTSPKKLKAYFLTGHGEHQLDSTDELMGYAKLGLVVQQNYVEPVPLSLVGSNTIPGDCSLLVAAGPASAFLEDELQKIDQFLNQGGRLLVLFRGTQGERECGLERLLHQWGVEVGSRAIEDDDHSPCKCGLDLVVSAFSMHPVVRSLIGDGIYLVQPRPVSKIHVQSPPAEAPRVEEIAKTCPLSVLRGAPAGEKPRAFAVMSAIEKGAIKGVTTARGATRILVVGDSLFLANHQIDLYANRDFVNNAVNWLVDRPQLIEDLGPRPVSEYRLVMTKWQLQSAEWILLGGMPGTTLLLGTMVWFWRRR